MYIIQRPLFDFDEFIIQVKEEERLVIVLEGLDVEKAIRYGACGPPSLLG